LYFESLSISAVNYNNSLL